MAPLHVIVKFGFNCTLLRTRVSHIKTKTFSFCEKILAKVIRFKYWQELILFIQSCVRNEFFSMLSIQQKKQAWTTNFKVNNFWSAFYVSYFNTFEMMIIIIIFNLCYKRNTRTCQEIGISILLLSGSLLIKLVFNVFFSYHKKWRNW